MYYLATQGELDKHSLMIEFESIIFADESVRENNIRDIITRLDKVLRDPRFIVPFVRAKRHNWLGVDSEQVIGQLMEYFHSVR